MNYPSKEVNPGLTFQPPKGKKVTTKTNNDKKVLMIPRGSKVKLKDTGYAMFLSMYDVYGNIKREGETDYLKSGDEDNYIVQSGKSYDFETVVNMTITNEYLGQKELNFNKLGKYLYFTLYVHGPLTYNSKTMRYEYTKAPAIYYFKFK